MDRTKMHQTAKKSGLKCNWVQKSLAPIKANILVTGSADMETFRKGGDSLAGRHSHFRLHSFSVREVGNDSREVTNQMLKLGGFPEPFLHGSERFASRWRRSHVDRILREDLRDLSSVRELKSIEILEQLMRERVGSTISHSSLAEDLQVSPHTIKHWLELLENLYVLFRVIPFSKNIAKSLIKEPK